ncbi:hypothetical protein DSO57_1010784 [Entomophthora muscae]|uniref:Uncharacterized protein n=1 Tax=Entomophthora muscae TaxID=34485 RepID=A0ACC2USF4_9FUNG|nr:hypothetical protein DSO57_1010784 [Entomophthora muscae]
MQAKGIIWATLAAGALSKSITKEVDLPPVFDELVRLQALAAKTVVQGGKFFEILVKGDPSTAANHENPVHSPPREFGFKFIF